jgi:hypothetical protein
LSYVRFDVLSPAPSDHSVGSVTPHALSVASMTVAGPRHIERMRVRDLAIQQPPRVIRRSARAATAASTPSQRLFRSSSANGSAHRPRSNQSRSPTNDLMFTRRDSSSALSLRSL